MRVDQSEERLTEYQERSVVGGDPVVSGELLLLSGYGQSAELQAEVVPLQVQQQPEHHSH